MMLQNGLDDLTNSGGWVAVVGGSVMWGLRLIIRRTAKDLTEVRNDLSQSDYIKTLREDADSLRRDIATMAGERNKSMAENGALLARVEMLTKQLDETKADLLTAKTQLDELRSQERHH